MFRSFQAIFGRPSLTEAGPGTLKDTTSLRALIDEKRNVHIVYVHGIKAEGPGATKAIIAFLKQELRFSEPAPFRDSALDLGPAPNATIFDQPLYEGHDWSFAQPFVRHHNLVRSDGAEVRISEVNYWPMLFPIKARFLMVPEHDLSGDDNHHLDIVKRNKSPFHNWIRSSDQAQLDRPIRGGRAAWINRFAKHDILNWGLSDAVIALGSMRLYLNHAMQLAFDAAFSAGDPVKDNYVVMAESLGSFVVLDAMDTQPAVATVMERTDYLYFFANQVALLELARVQGLPTGIPVEQAGPQPAIVATTTAETPRPSPFRMLERWGRPGRALVDQPRQIIAFSDPSDILTYRVPAIPGVTVVNVYDRNTPRWFGLFADPGRAHLGHLENKAVWAVLTR